MGARAQILIRDTGVYLYDHWGAEFCDRIVNSIQSALRHDWDDAECLAGNIFREMVMQHAQMVASAEPSDNAESLFWATTGVMDKIPSFGIGTEQHGDTELLITIDCESGTIEIKPFPEREGCIAQRLSIDDFLKTDENTLHQYCRPSEKND